MAMCRREANPSLKQSLHRKVPRRGFGPVASPRLRSVAGHEETSAGYADKK